MLTLKTLLSSAKQKLHWLLSDFQRAYLWLLLDFLLRLLLSILVVQIFKFICFDSTRFVGSVLRSDKFARFNYLFYSSFFSSDPNTTWFSSCFFEILFLFFNCLYLSINVDKFLFSSIKMRLINYNFISIKIFNNQNSSSLVFPK